MHILGKRPMRQGWIQKQTPNKRHKQKQIENKHAHAVITVLGHVLCTEGRLVIYG